MLNLLVCVSPATWEIATVCYIHACIHSWCLVGCTSFPPCLEALYHYLWMGGLGGGVERGACLCGGCYTRAGASVTHGVIERGLTTATTAATLLCYWQTTVTPNCCARLIYGQILWMEPWTTYYYCVNLYSSFPLWSLKLLVHIENFLKFQCKQILSATVCSLSTCSAH